MSDSLWDKCLVRLEGELSSQQFNTWIRPLHAVDTEAGLRLLAPNRFVLDWVAERFTKSIEEFATDILNKPATITLEIGSQHAPGNPDTDSSSTKSTNNNAVAPTNNSLSAAQKHVSSLNPNYVFDNFVEGKSNQLAKAASIQVGQNPGKAYNPLFIYGGVGLGKTHLMHAVGNLITKETIQRGNGQISQTDW